MIMAQTLVSVVMPSFNQAEFIEAAVRSVLDQDHQPLELIVMDGGSTDGTLQCLESLAAAYGPRLRWLSAADAGPAHAINKALRLARGDIIGWLNSDDLYAPGAVAAALAQFAAQPDTMMLYGEGQHIDAAGQPLNRYPTRPPESIQAFHDGCFICQPTVFLRREVFEAVGLLDESLGTAFDFELWLRIFRRFPQQIGHIDRVLAFSRLHGACITQRLRRQIAVEGMQVLAQHLGHAQPHWLLTYFDELYAAYPFGDVIADLPAHVAAVLEQIKPCVDAAGWQRLQQAVADDARLRLALPGVGADVYADGWAPPLLTVRCRDVAARSLRLRCVHSRPQFAPLPITIKPSWGRESRVVVERPGVFNLSLPLPKSAAGGQWVVLIESQNWFVPQALDETSTDSRQLAFKVESLQLSHS
jgi:glycosyltransferase involved in cell wall biosynthesis